MIDSAELKLLKKLKPWRGTLAYIADWLLIFTCFYTAVTINHWVVYLLSIIIIARSQHALFMMMHEAAHFTLHKSKNLNNVVGQFLLAGPGFFSLFAYRRNHFEHHKHPVVAGDHYPISRRDFYMELLQDILCISHFSYMKFFIVKSIERKRKRQAAHHTALDKNINRPQPLTDQQTLPSWLVIISIVLSNSIIFSFFYLMGQAWAYFLLWPLPLASVLLAFIRIRGVSEHGGFEESEDSMLSSRTVVNPWQAFFIHPHDSNYHIEHHLFPNVPYYNLKKIHLKIKNSYNERNLYKSYLDVIRELTY